MLTLAQAIRRKSASGEPLPDVFPSLAARGVKIRRGELTLVVGPPSAGKSLLMFVLLARLALPGIAFLLDSTELEATTKFAAILTGEPFLAIERKIGEGDESYAALLTERLPDLHACFYAPSYEDTRRELDAFEQRYGTPPPVMVLDNMGNQTSALGDEWAVLKALALELSNLAQSEEIAVVAAHHTSDITTMEPAARDKVLGKISQYPRTMLSVNFDPDSREYKVAIVKQRGGASDPAAKHPVTMWADPGRMAITEHSQVAGSWRHQKGIPAERLERAEYSAPMPADQRRELAEHGMSLQAGELPATRFGGF